MSENPKWAVSGRAWSAETRSHTKLVTVEFERRVDAKGFISLNSEWIAGMVIDRNEAAQEADKNEGVKVNDYYYNS